MIFSYLGNIFIPTVPSDTIILYNRKNSYYYNSHFTDEETDPWKLSASSQITKLMNAKQGIQLLLLTSLVLLLIFFFHSHFRHTYIYHHINPWHLSIRLGCFERLLCPACLFLLNSLMTSKRPELFFSVSSWGSKDPESSEDLTKVTEPQ